MSFLDIPIIWWVVGVIELILVITFISIIYQKSKVDKRKDLYLTIKELDYDIVPYEMMIEHISDKFGLRDEEAHQAIAEGIADHIDYFKKLDI